MYPRTITLLFALLALVAATSLKITSQCYNKGQKINIPGKNVAKKVKILQGNWLGAEIDTKIAEILISEKLKFPVQILPVQAGGQSAVFPLVNNGTAHVMMEAWPSEHVTDKTIYTNVNYNNALGVIGKLGWYIPTATAILHPELITVNGLKSAAANTYLSTSATAPKGAILNGGTAAEPFITYVDEIIAGLGLNLKKVFGTDPSETAHITAIGNGVAQAAATNPGIPRLFFFYEPNAAFALYNLTAVNLPATTPCGTPGVNCNGYSADNTFKAIWKGLAAFNPKANTLLTRITISNSVQSRLMANAQTSSVTDVVCGYLKANPALVNSWLNGLVGASGSGSSSDSSSSD